MPLNLATTRERLQSFDFGPLFIEDLGWEPPASRKPQSASVKDCAFTLKPVAQLSGIGVFEVTADHGAIPDAKTRAAIHKLVSETCYENLLIFTDKARTQSLWYWVKRESGKAHARDHLYVKGQPGDLFLAKLAAMVVDLGDLDEEGHIATVEVAGRLKAALDVEKVTKKFYGEFDTQRLAFYEHIHGIKDETRRRWYASVLMNRLMFIWFLQKKHFLDGGNTDYLVTKLAESKTRGKDRFFREFLACLFFEGFAQPEGARSPAAKKLLGRIRYLNGGLFLPHRIELDHDFPGDESKLRIPDIAFENVFALFARYSWNLNDTPGGNDQEINPDVLGYIFEKYINQKQFGAYYTRPEITGYLCERTIHRLVQDRLEKALGRKFASIADLLLDLDAPAAKALLFDILPSLRLLDPACGSAAFLVAAMKVLITVYSAVIGRIEFLNDSALKKWLAETRAAHPSILYFIKKRIITDNLFGVDIMEEATEIARLRLFLALVASADTEDQLEPLPNIDFNILAGNSLIGLLHVDPAKFDGGAPSSRSARESDQDRLTLQHAGELGFTVETKSAPTQKEKAAAFIAARNASKFAALLADKNKSIELYRQHAFSPVSGSAGVPPAVSGVAPDTSGASRRDAAKGTRDARAPQDFADLVDQDERVLRLREHIEHVRRESYARLNQMLLDEFHALGIQFEQATWDDAKKKAGKPRKRPLTLADLEALHPFHWGYEFDKVMAAGGFDAILANPPWEIFKPQAKEFFDDHSALVSKNKMTIKEFEKEQARLLKNPEIREAWLEFLGRFPHVSLYYRNAAQFKNQVSIVNGKKAGTDINLYKLFLEQSFRLLRDGGQCGIVIPGSITSDLGAKQLREMLFDQTELNRLLLLSNERYLFEGVHHDQQFCLVTFSKGGKTQAIDAAFRIDVREAIGPDRLDGFLHADSELLRIPVSLVRRLAPESSSIMDFRDSLDVKIAEAMITHPLLGSNVERTWNLVLCNEFHMTGDSDLYIPKSGKGRLPLFEGKMIHQFVANWGEPQYWLDEKAAAERLRGTRIRELRKLAKAAEADFDERIEIDLDYTRYRIAFRDVGPATNERSMICTILPPRVFCPHTMSLEKVFHGNVEGGKIVANSQKLSDAERLFVCAVLNSFVVDAWLRKSITKHLSFFYVYATPVPRLTSADAAFGPIVERAARLVCTTPEFDALAVEAATELAQSKIGNRKSKMIQGVTDPAARARLRAELDALVAHLYGLTESEFTHILGTFPLVKQDVKDAALACYHEFAPHPDAAALASVIAAGENAGVEFKEAAIWNRFKVRKDDKMRANVAVAVAGLMNHDGGQVIIGVTDHGQVVGLVDDMKAADPRKPNPDGYELWLRNYLRASLGAENTKLVEVSFHDIKSKPVCQLRVQRAPAPVFFEGRFYVRQGNQTPELNAKESAAYQKNHWHS